MRSCWAGALPYWRARMCGGIPVARTSNRLCGRGGCGHLLERQHVSESLLSVLYAHVQLLQE